ncbi:MAG: hypothetical protein K0R18_545 [Bacillales bacterium]|jgi:hypothetical protein|nr:hypothetical protein [Bacillales bacterium]
MKMWQSRIPQLSTSDLITLAKDAEHRIGLHVAGGDPVQVYVERQQTLLTLIQEELVKRA